MSNYSITTGKHDCDGNANPLADFRDSVGGLGLKCPSSNSETVYIGVDPDMDTGDEFPLEPGDGIAFDVDYPGQLHVKGESGDSLHYITVGA